MNSIHNPSFDILLVDDNIADCILFKEALRDLPISVLLSTVDGENLMNYFSNKSDKLPDIIFLDLNMPCKNGFECLAELKLSKTLYQIPVIIYSTAFDEMVADELFKNGAHYYVQKTDLMQLKEVLCSILPMLAETKFASPARNKFLFSLASVSTP